MKKAIFLLIVFFAETTFAQDNSLTIGGEFRTKALLDMGYKAPKEYFDAPVFSISQRTRLNAEFQNKKITGYISMQDVRFWGDDNNYSGSGSFGNSNSLMLCQAWVNIGCTEKSSLKIGRQQFSYDDQRLLSSRGWNDYQVSYDALLFQRKDSLFNLDLALSYNSESSKNNLLDPIKFKTIDFIHLSKDFKNFGVSLISVYTGKTESSVSEKLIFTSTHGVNFTGLSKKWPFMAAVYYQHNLSDNEKVSAYCLAMKVGRTFSDNNMKTELGFDYISGNDATNTGTNHSFDLLYGRRHAYYGYLDYFSTTPSQGLEDIYLRNTVKISKKFSTEITIHSFLLAEEISGGTYDNNLGQEADLVLKYKFADCANLEAGYSYYFRTNTLDYLKNTENVDVFPPQFLYVMLSVKPKFRF
ncbi:MAG: hypothetical protein C0592_02095 [Marinilabiliales bacterium]|nr:MAG: hypothetical protein C0592_02095 [Marinilabiliales bacterium]